MSSKQNGGFWAEFRTFAVKGNALELAIAVVVGNAFGAIVNSLVADIITPFIGFVTPGGTSDIKSLAFTLRPAMMQNGTTTPALMVHYGTFIQTIINFFIISLSIFLVFKLLSSARERLWRKKEEVPQHDKSAEERLLEEIRDLLKAGR